MINIYDFYKLTDEDAASLVGQVIEEEDRPKQKPADKRKTPHPPKKWASFFPIGLNESCFNYGKRYGLIGVSNVFENYNKQPYFRVYALSPDDLDMGITFDKGNLEELRQEIYDFMLSLPFEETSYREVLELIISHVGQGEIGL